MQPMDQPDVSLSPKPPTESPEDLKEQLASLRGVVTVMLAALVFLGLGLTLYLYRQVAFVNGQVVEARRAVEDYNTNTFPRVESFIVQLNYYARTNADFKPFLSKYGLLLTNMPSAPTPATPATPVKK
jgi:hypothetical protein